MTDLPDFYAGGADVVLRPEWAAVQATDKDLEAHASNQSRGNGATILYTVPVAKSLYITLLSYMNYGYDIADGDKISPCKVEVFDGAAIRFEAGSDLGGVAPLSKPLRFDAGHLLQFQLTNVSAHNTTCGLAVSGYEVPV